MVEVLFAVVEPRRHPNAGRYAECSKERWDEVFSAYPARMRQHAANMAAHSMDVLLVDGEVLIVKRSLYGDETSGFWLPREDDFLAKRSAMPEELARLYAPHERRKPTERLFPLPEVAQP